MSYEIKMLSREHIQRTPLNALCVCPIHYFFPKWLKWIHREAFVYLTDRSIHSLFISLYWSDDNNLYKYELNFIKNKINDFKKLTNAHYVALKS